MPKDIFSKREDLVCGKIDRLFDLLPLGVFPIDTECEICDLIHSIVEDVNRMEKKLISRKEEAGENIEYHQYQEDEHWEGFQVQDKD
jgi:hypothetical protein